MSDRRIAKNIYWTPYGWRIYVRVNRRLKPKRIHDPEHALGLVKLKELRDDWRTDARRALGLPVPIASSSTPSTFAEDVREKYLPAVRSLPTYEERARHMELWTAEFGTRARSEIQPWEIAKVRERWLTVGPKMVCRRWDSKHPRPADVPKHVGRWMAVQAPLSPAQVNRRLRALENFYTVLDGRHAFNPVRAAGEAREPDSVPRAIPYAVVEAILNAMPESAARRRLRVIAYTGLSHGELMGITEDDLHLRDTPPWVQIKGRRKGEGTSGVAHPLTKPGAAALKAMLRHGDFGPFSPDSMRQCFRRACATLKLRGLRPYDLRHSYATEILEKTNGNIGALQLAMRHKDPRTSLQYAKRAIDPVRLATIRQVEAKGGFRSRRRAR